VLLFPAGTDFLKAAHRWRLEGIWPDGRSPFAQSNRRSTRHLLGEPLLTPFSSQPYLRSLFHAVTATRLSSTLHFAVLGERISAIRQGEQR
jgi:hypothetical protein